MLTEHFVPSALGLMMIALGMSLTIEDFRKLALQPIVLVSGVFCQVVVLPLLGVGLVKLLHVPGLLAMNLMILVCCAGGVVSALFTKLANGDVALSVSMTIITLLTSVVTIPFIINTSLVYFLGQDTAQLSLLGTSIRLIAFTVLPVSIGMFIRFRYERFSMKLQPYVSKAGIGFLLTAIILTLLQDFSSLLAAAKDMFLVLFYLNVIAMAVGYGAGKILKLSMKHKKTLAIEVGVQNSATGIFIATTLLHNAELALGAYIYTIIAFFNVAVLILIWRFLLQRPDELAEGFSYEK